MLVLLNWYTRVLSYSSLVRRHRTPSVFPGYRLAHGNIWEISRPSHDALRTHGGGNAHLKSKATSPRPFRCTRHRSSPPNLTEKSPPSGPGLRSVIGLRDAIGPDALLLAQASDTARVVRTSILDTDPPQHIHSSPPSTYSPILVFIQVHCAYVCLPSCARCPAPLIRLPCRSGLPIPASGGETLNAA